MSLFDNSAELHAMLSRLQFGGDDVSRVLRERIVMQRLALPDLGRFAQDLDARRYDQALELVASVAARFAKPERLETHLLALECDFVKLKARAGKAHSGRRYEPFWREFDDGIKRRICITAKTAFDHAAARTPEPHPKMSVAEKRFRDKKRNL
ncbi:hypothetical protein [Burkholderia gladioli]|uniref:hypothetical protein n=1 Tax=Burkholderia gladioli TaxID=28095 RepID=UPI0013F61106|nr:hypothetical protein [Burkholderia gladioli]